MAILFRILPKRIWQFRDIFNFEEVQKFDDFCVKFVNFGLEKVVLMLVTIVTIRPYSAKAVTKIFLLYHLNNSLQHLVHDNARNDNIIL